MITCEVKHGRIATVKNANGAMCSFCKSKDLPSLEWDNSDGEYGSVVICSSCAITEFVRDNEIKVGRKNE